jgi:hypothetical protein
MATAYLKIENPGTAPAEAFTLLGASTKRESTNSGTIGKFGTGNKHGVAVLLRAGLEPQIFCGNLKLGFTTRPQQMDDGLRVHTFNRVVVQYGGKTATGQSRTGTEDLGFVLEHGATDWLSTDLALREFVSNAIDRAVEEGEAAFLANWLQAKGPEFISRAKEKYSSAWDETNEALEAYRQTATDYKNVTVEIVNENQVRAKAGVTRVFIPMNEDVFRFHANIGKWFLHFSEPELLNQTILPKRNRNLGDKQTAVIYRRGVRVREFESNDTPSLFDYNLENLQLDESRRVDDWRVQWEAARAFCKADKKTLGALWQAMIDGRKVWEHEFSETALQYGMTPETQKAWTESFEAIVGDQAVICAKDGGVQAARKGYKVVEAPEAIVRAAKAQGVKTPDMVLSNDEREGREVLDSTPDAEAAVDFVWNVIEKYKLANGRKRPTVKTFRKIMDGGGQTLGFYRDGVVYINQDIAGFGALQTGWHNLTQQLLVTALEECVHHATGGAIDGSRDIQDFSFNLSIYLAKELAGIA